MVMSHDPGFKFQNFLFFAQFSNKFLEKLPNLGEIGQGKKRYGQKNKLGVENTPLPVLIGLMSK